MDTVYIERLFVKIFYWLTLECSFQDGDGICDDEEENDITVSILNLNEEEEFCFELFNEDTTNREDVDMANDPTLEEPPLSGTPPIGPPPGGPPPCDGPPCESFNL